MKHLRIFTRSGIVLLTTILIGFSVESGAIFNCNKCDKTYYDKKKSEVRIGGKSLCKTCGEKYKQKQRTDVNSVLDRQNKLDDCAITPPTKRAKRRVLDSYYNSSCYLFIAKKSEQGEVVHDTFYTRTGKYYVHKNDATEETDHFAYVLELPDIGQFLSMAMGALEENGSRISQALSIKEKGTAEVGRQEISNMLRHTEYTKADDTATDHLLPDFVATFEDHEETKPTLLFERKTIENIQPFLNQEKINTDLYVITKNKKHCSEEEFVYHKITIEKHGRNDKGKLYFFNENPLPQWREISISHLEEIIALCEQWAKQHDKIVGIYEVTEYKPHYKTNVYCQKTEFNDNTLLDIIRNFGSVETYNSEDCTELCRDSNKSLVRIRGNDKSIQIEQAGISFIDWYQQEWPGPEQNKPYFIIELMGITAESIPNPRIVVAQLKNDTYGINLLEGVSDQFTVFRTQQLGELAKQLMWMTKDIKVFVIKE